MSRGYRTLFIRRQVRYSISSNLTGRFSWADFFAASPMATEINPSLPGTGTFSCLLHWDTLAGFSQDFVWDFVRQLLFLIKTNTILANKDLKSY